MDVPVITATNLEKVYGYGRNALRVIKGVSLAVSRGDVVSIMGPSGAGKSTLLNLMGCLDGFQKGSLSVMGKDVSNLSVEELSGFRNRHLGFIFQFHNLLPEFTALENVMMPLLIRRISPSQARKKSKDLLDRFQLSDRIDHKPSELSGGECQRVAVARAIVGNPDIIMADEPTGSLDSINSKILTETLLELGRENKTTIVIVTHDTEIAGMARRIISLVDGKIISDMAEENNKM